MHRARPQTTPPSLSLFSMSPPEREQAHAEDDTASAFSTDTTEGPNRRRGGRSEPAHVDEAKVDYLLRSYPHAFSEVETLRAKYGTAYARLIHVKLINGLLRDLGMGTGGEQKQERTVQFEGRWLTIGTYDVVRALKLKDQTFRAWRSNMRLANRLYQWMDSHQPDWVADTPEGRQRAEFFEALKLFFRAERLPGLHDVRPSLTHVDAFMGSPSTPRHELALQRARGWHANTMEEDVKEMIRQLGMDRRDLPPAWPLVD